MPIPVIAAIAAKMGAVGAKAGATAAKAGATAAKTGATAAKATGTAAKATGTAAKAAGAGGQAASQGSFLSRLQNAPRIGGGQSAAPSKGSALPSKAANIDNKGSVSNRIRSYMQSVPDEDDGRTRGEILREGLNEARMGASEAVQDAAATSPAGGYEPIPMQDLLRAYGLR